MATGKMICFLLLFFVSFICVGQTSFADWPKTKTENDTLFQVIRSQEYFDYFVGAIGAYAVAYAEVDFSNEDFEQVLTTHTASKSGYLRIYFRGKVVFQYEIQNYSIEGIGVRFNFESGDVLLQGLFQDGKLNGPLIEFVNGKAILFIAKYKKGKFKKYLYHADFKGKHNLKRLNKKARDPMQPLLIKM